MIKTNIFVLVLRLPDVVMTSCKNLFKKSSRCLAKTCSKCLRDVLKTYCQNVFKTFSRPFEDVFQTYHQSVLVNTFSRRPRDIFSRFLRLTAKTVICRRICLGHTPVRFMVSEQICKSNKNFSSISFYFTTPFSDFLRRCI